MKYLLRTIFSDQRIRFVFVGVINTGVGYGTYATALLFGLNAYVSTIAQTITGVVCSYFLNKYFTFNNAEKSFAQVARFISVYGVSFAMNMLLVYIFVYRMHINEYVSGLVCLFFITIISYFGHKYFSFRSEYAQK